MDNHIEEYIAKYPSEVVEVFNKIKDIIYDSLTVKSKEILWAKLPSYYVGDAYVRLIPFKDHINIEAQAAIQHKKMS